MTSINEKSFFALAEVSVGARPPDVCLVTWFEDLLGKNRLLSFEIYPVTRFFQRGSCALLSEWPEMCTLALPVLAADFTSNPDH